MNKLKIKTILYILIILVTTLSATYMYFSYKYIRESTITALNTQSIDRAYEVTKRMSALNDKMTWEYDKHNSTMYKTLRFAQDYFEKNGRNASVKKLKKLLDDNTNSLSYHIYLVNNKHIIESTSFAPDLNLNFHIIPEADKVMTKAFENPNYIDLSSAVNDVITNTYKKYIVQKARNQDFIIQISVTIENKENLQDLINQAAIEIPNLLDIQMYVLFLNNKQKLSIDILYKKKYKKGSKSNKLVQMTLFNNFAFKLNHNEKIDDHNFKQYINKFIKDSKYKGFYFHRDGKYIHKIIMSFYSYINYKENTIFIISMELDESEAERTIQEMNNIAYFVSFIVFILLVLSIIIINTRIIIPIQNLQLRMKSKESIDAKMISNHYDEVGSMSIAYNQLLQDLNREITTNEELLEEFKNFTANTIHQVRTPVSVIKIALEMIDTTNKDAVLQIKASLISIEHMYDSLSYALHHENINFPPDKLNLSLLLKQRVELFSTIAEAYDTKIVANIKNDLIVNMNALEAEYLIDNNLSNSIKYGTTGKEISVSLSKVDTDIFLSFNTFGKEIEDTEIIFNRYHREHKDKKGHGIGLHMVGTICKNNNILIKVDYFSEKNNFLYFFKEYVT